MGKVALEQGAWVVVCDGRKVLILENSGDARFPNLKTREERHLDNPSTQQQGTERPGRVHASVGTARSAVEQTDWHDQAEVAFLREVAKRLNAAALRGETKSLVLAAPPRALGVLRAALSAQAAKLVLREIDKDYVHLPVGEIEKRLLA